MEADVGIAPTRRAFAEPDLTTWLIRRKIKLTDREYCRAIFVEIGDLLIWNLDDQDSSVVKLGHLLLHKTRVVSERLFIDDCCNFDATFYLVEYDLNVHAEQNSITEMFLRPGIEPRISGIPSPLRSREAWSFRVATERRRINQ